MELKSVGYKMKIDEGLNKLIWYVLGSVLTLVLSSGVGSLKELSSSVNELNVKIGVIVERTENLQKRVETYEDRLREIEIKRR